MEKIYIKIIDNAHSIYIIKNAISRDICDKFSNEKYFIDVENTGQESNHTVQSHRIVLGDNNKNDELIFLQKTIATTVIPNMINILKDTNPHIFYGIKSIKYQTLEYRQIFGKTLQCEDQDVCVLGSRLISFIIALNDNYDEGIINFNRQNIDVKLEKGDILISPPYWTHPHSVSSPMKNYRYTITSWLISSNDCDSIKNDNDENNDTDSCSDISILSDQDDWSVYSEYIDIGAEYRY